MWIWMGNFISTASLVSCHHINIMTVLSRHVKPHYQIDEFVAIITIYVGPLITIMMMICNKTEQGV